MSLTRIGMSCINFLIFPVANIILYYTPISQKVAMESLNCAQSVIISICAMLYACYNMLFTSYANDIDFIRYKTDWVVENMLEMVIGYLIIDTYYGYRLSPSMTILSHHILGIIAFTAVRLTGYGYLFAIYFMITEITTPMLILARYINRETKVALIYKMIVIVIYFVMRIMPIPYLLFLILQILTHKNENVVMATLASLTIPSICLINIIWFCLILRKLTIISRMLKIFLIFTYITYCTYLSMKLQRLIYGHKNK